MIFQWSVTMSTRKLNSNYIADFHYSMMKDRVVVLAQERISDDMGGYEMLYTPYSQEWAFFSPLSVVKKKNMQHAQPEQYLIILRHNGYYLIHGMKIRHNQANYNIVSAKSFGLHNKFWEIVVEKTKEGL